MSECMSAPCISVTAEAARGLWIPRTDWEPSCGCCSFMNHKLIIYEPEKVILKVFFTILKKINPPSLCVCMLVSVDLGVNMP